jgi:nicotinamidase-related amidase
MKPDALLVIDVQTGLVNAHPYGEETLIANIQKLLAAFRAAKLPVIYVCHDGGDEFLTHGTPDWEIARAIAPQADEPVFEKRVGSAFRNSNLDAYLRKLGIKNLVICGMQTEFCVDTNVKVASELGYNVLIPSEGTATFNTRQFLARDLIAYYETHIWGDELAQVVPMDELLASVQS